MSFYRSTKFAIDCFRSIISTRSRLADSQARLFKRYNSSSSSNLSRNKKIDRYQVYDFKQQNKSWRRKFDNLFRYTYQGCMVIVFGGILVQVYHSGRETIPYTKRVHFVSLTHNAEKRLGEFLLERQKNDSVGKVLTEKDPQHVRVTLIANRIIKALQRGIKQDDIWRNDKGCARERKHLEELNWEVVVVNEPIVNAYCVPGGKIVVYTGLLKHFTTDDEIATIIGHEVAHAVARHTAESMTRTFGFIIIMLILLPFFTDQADEFRKVCDTIYHFLCMLPASRRNEIEADYIGLLLMSSAGYNPRLAPKVYEKLGQMSESEESSLQEYTSTHPSGKKRAQLLAQAQTMEEALAMHKEVSIEDRVEDHGQVE